MLTDGCVTVAAGQDLTVQVTGQGGVPAVGMEAAVLTVHALDPAGLGLLTVYPADIGFPGTVNPVFEPGKPIANSVTAKLNADAKVKVRNYSPDPINVGLVVSGRYAAPTGGDGGTYTPLNPKRIADTRPGLQAGICDGGGSCATIPAGGSRLVKVTGQGGVPGSVSNLAAVDVGGGSGTGTRCLAVTPDGNAGLLVTAGGGTGVSAGASGFLGFMASDATTRSELPGSAWGRVVRCRGGLDRRFWELGQVGGVVAWIVIGGAALDWRFWDEWWRHRGDPDTDDP